MNKKKINIDAVIATNRFGLGAKPGEIDLANKNPKQWLIDSLSNITPPPQAPTAMEMMRVFAEYKQQKEEIKEKTSAAIINEKETEKTHKLKPEIEPNHYLNENSALIINEALKSNSSINWRLLDFFSNHFSVSTNSSKTKLVAPSLEWDAIAPNLMEHFDSMLIAVISHPAMLFYLNNEKSIGPNSEKGRNQKSLGLNENLAREILELHTLGVNAGYSQTDVIELAKAITGWSVVKTSKPNEMKKKNAFIFRKNYHQLGRKTILKKRYAPSMNSKKEGGLILKDLAVHPATAEHICTKLAKHFISDTPPLELISAMKATWLNTKGHLKSVYTTMIDSNHSWQPDTQKYKTPREFLISTFRGLNISDTDSNTLIDDLAHLGQTPYGAGSPAGYGDTRADWDGADALYARIEWAVRTAKQNRKHSITQLTKTVLGEHLEKQTELIISKAESQQQGLSLLLLSPDFLHR